MAEVPAIALALLLATPGNEFQKNDEKQWEDNNKAYWAAHAEEKEDGNSLGTNSAKPPKDPQAITNPPQVPPIPEDWVIVPNPKRPGGIIATPPGVTPGSSDKGNENIRVDPPGSSPVPGLDDGYWRWNKPGVGAYNPDKGNFGGTQGQTHVPLPPGYDIPPPRP